jgi:hypothetical protein
MEMSAMQERPRASAMTSDALNEPLPHGDQNLSGPHLNRRDSRPGLGAGHRLLTSLWRALAGTTNASHRRLYSPPYYLEHARLSREIDRL